MTSQVQKRELKEQAKTEMHARSAESYINQYMNPIGFTYRIPRLNKKTIRWPVQWIYMLYKNNWEYNNHPGWGIYWTGTIIFLTIIQLSFAFSNAQNPQ